MLRGYSSTTSLFADPFQAGLTTEERDLIAKAYDDGVLKACVATCSLAAGINCEPTPKVLSGQECLELTKLSACPTCDSEQRPYGTRPRRPSHAVSRGRHDAQ
jgi:hypothetical protein